MRTVPELLQLGSALSDAPLSEEAVEVARELEAAQPADEQEWRQACELLDRIGSGTACQVVTERFLRSDPTNPTANLAAAEYWSRSHLNYSKAELHLRRSVDHTAGGADFWARAAVLWQRMERWPECAKACREWLDARPDTKEAKPLYAKALWLSQRVKQAGAFLRKWEADVQDSPDEWAVLACSSAEARENKIARRACGRAMGSGAPQNDLVYRFHLAKAYMFLNDDRVASQHVQAVIAHNSDNSWLWEQMVRTASRCRCAQATSMLCEGILRKQGLNLDLRAFAAELQRDTQRPRRRWAWFGFG